MPNLRWRSDGRWSADEAPALAGADRGRIANARRIDAACSRSAARSSSRLHGRSTSVPEPPPPRSQAASGDGHS